MSATRTTNGRSTHVNGFNEHTYYDPFFPSSPSEEQLVPTALSPITQSNHSPSPSPSKISNATPSQISTSPQHTYDLSHVTPQKSQLANGVEHPDTEQTLQDTFNYTLAEDLLAPGAYLSDNEYEGSREHTLTPELGEDFYLENHISLIGDPDLQADLDYSQAHLNNHTLDNPLEDRKISEDSNKTGTTSLGTANLSSHLMSPVLTERASPASRDGDRSPRPEDAMDFEITDTTPRNSGDMSDVVAAQMQHTPALTGSSKNTSPDRNFQPDIARAASPIFRIESYSRGDSPSRPQGLMARTGSKRSRASSHLAVEQGDSSEDGEGEHVQDDYFQQHTSPATHDTRGRSSEISDRPGLDPLARLQVSSEEVPNFKDQEESAQSAQRNADVEEWLLKSEGNSNVGEAKPGPARAPTFSKRRRAKSAGDGLSRENLESLKNTGAPPADLHIPGPGLLLDEESGDEDVMSDEDEDEEVEGSDIPESPIATIDEINQAAAAGSATPEMRAANPEASLYRAKMWQDPIYDSTDPGVKMQPATSNEAMHRYEQRSRELDNLSRAATWGTRRLSESDIAGLFHRLSFTPKDGTAPKEKPERRGTFLEQAAAKLRPKRSGSMLKRKESDTPRPVARPTALEHSKKDSSSSLGLPTPIKRISSLNKKPKSPRIDTGSAVAGIASMAALGAGAAGPTSATATSPPGTPWAAVKNTIKRTRSRSDLHPPSPTSNLGGLWTKQGGPPMPALAAPSKEDLAPQPVARAEEPEDEDDEIIEDKGVSIDFSIRTDPIIPTLDGFRHNVKQLNPRLPPYMVERISQEQLRRFKKLMEFKVKHVQVISNKKCPSGKNCTSLGGEPSYLPSKSSTKEPELSHTGFSVAGLAPSDDDTNALSDGIVTPAQFPSGVPMPPVKRLPAEFECSLCFKVKKFQKPSDWSKHVHEDVQPFTCTFVNCTEPKSFKRKADWVRHENERHRQLEWWLCNIQDCTHRCYRKDNFVQHLVREHKLPEPKLKTMKASKPAVRGPSAQKARRQMEEQSEELPEEIDQVWRLVEQCRHETPKNPKDEACKFCGNVCNSWKKLTVHLAKHMEQISMPVLNIVDQMHVTPDTIISPIERSSQQPSMSPSVTSPFPHASASAREAPYAYGPSHLPGNFTQVQSPSAYYPGMHQTLMMSNLQRHGPATYPPQLPSSNSSPGYPSSRPGAYGMSSLSGYETPSTPSYITVNEQGGYPPSSSPEAMFNMPSQASSQLQTNPYGAEGPYQPPYNPQQQQHPDAVKAEHTPQYTFPRPSPPMPQYPQQAPTSAPMHFQTTVAAGDLTGMGYSQPPMDQAMYGQHANQTYGYQ